MIEFEIPEELKSAVSKFGIDHGIIIKIMFTEEYDKKAFNSVFMKKKFEKSLNDFEKGLKKSVPKITEHHLNLIENTIYENLHKIEPTDKIDKDNFDKQHTNNHIKYLRKYELDSILYEAIIVDKVPKFVFYDNGGTFKLVEKLKFQIIHFILLIL